CALQISILSDIYGTEAHCIEVLDAVTIHPWVITCIGNALIVAAIIARLISRQPTGAEVVTTKHVQVPEKLEKLLLMVNLSTKKLDRKSDIVNKQSIHS